MKEHPNYGKSRDDLAQDLFQLKSDYKLLKDSYEKNLAEKTQNEKSLLILNKLSVELLNLSPADKLEAIVSRIIKEITGAKAAVFSGYNPDTRCLHVQHIEMDQVVLSNILKLLDTQVTKIASPVSDETFKLITTELIGVRETLHEASFGAISKTAGAAIQKLLKVDRFIGVVYMVDGKLYGTSLLAMDKSQPDPPRQILENIIFLAAVTLKRKRAEEAMKESEERYNLERRRAMVEMQQILSELQALIDNVQQGILMENEDRVIQFANKKFCELFGISSPGDIKGCICLDLAYQAKDFFKDAAGFITTIEKRLKEKIVVLSEEILLADGRCFERDYIPVFTEGKIFRNYWIYRDITERKQAEQSLRESQSQISALLKAIPDMIFIQDIQGNYIDYHAPEGTQLYAPPEVFRGKNMNEILPSEMVTEFQKVFDRTLKTRMVQNFEYSLPMPGGIAYFESRTIAYACDRILSLVRDIAERKQAEFKIQEQIRELSKLNEDKNKFMSILAHDLKSPFNSILGLLRLLSENIHYYDVAKTEKLINTVRNSSEHFFNLLESLLLWSRSQSGKMLFEPQRLDFMQICNEIIEEVRLNAEAKNIFVSLKEKAYVHVFADIEMLKTILRNLISNAIKFTQNGGKITISIKKQKKWAIIEVADNGIGVDPDKVQKLFNISSAFKTKGTAGESGTGLGLLICKELVEKHGGTIRAESELTKGTRFIFSLPFS